MGAGEGDKPAASDETGASRSVSLADYKGLDLLRTKSVESEVGRDGFSRANTGLTWASEADAKGEQQKGAGEKKKRRKSSTVATERLLASQGVAQDEDAIPKGRIPVIHPHNPYYLKWWYFTMFIAIIMATVDPIQLTFINSTGFYPYNDFWAVTDFIAIAVFGLDLLSKFFLSYNDPEEGMIRDHKRIALNYLKGLFWVDLITTVPIESIVVEALDIQNVKEDDRAIFLGLIRWLKIGRLYRIFDLFEMLDHKMVVSQLSITLLRNFTYMFFVAHWMGCILYYLAKAEGFTENSWVGGNKERFERNEGWVDYFFSFYFSMIIFTGFGDNDFYGRNPLETCFVTGYLLINIILQAYILGSITTVMVSADERSNEFRTRVESLNEFAEMKEIPPDLHNTMRQHLELRYHSERTADDAVLKHYPPTIRKKALRHMYLDILRNCYLFQGCKARFLDEILSMARMELFMPHMSILSEGEVVSELMIVVDGEVQGARAGSAAALLHSGSSRRKSSDVGDEMLSSGVQRMKTTRRNSVAFPDNVDASAISRANSQALGSGKPAGDASGVHPPLPGAMSGRRRSSVMFDAPPNEAQAQFTKLGSGGMGSRGGSQKGAGGSMRRNSVNSSGGGFGSMGSDWYGGASDASMTLSGTSEPVAEIPFFTEVPCLQNFWTGCLARVLIISKSQMDKLGEQYPMQVKQVLANMREHADEAFRLAVADALAACEPPAPQDGVAYDSEGKPISPPGSGRRRANELPDEVTEAVHDALAGGQSFTAKAMRRPMRGLKDALPPDQRSQLQRLEQLRSLAVKYLRKQELKRVYAFISAAADVDMGKLRLLMAQGVSPSSADYDKRTALMVAAHEGNEGVVKLLLENRANANMQDAFGLTAMFEAVRMGHDNVIQLMKACRVKLAMDSDRVIDVMINAICAGDIPLLQRLISAGGDPNWGDYDQRTPLHVAAREGNLPAVELLVEEGKAAVDARDRWDCTPLDSARRVGAQPVVEYLEPLLEEVKQGERKGWKRTEWFKHCMQETQRARSPEPPPPQQEEPTPAQRRKRPSTATIMNKGVTSKGYTKRGSLTLASENVPGANDALAASVGRRGSMMLPPGAALRPFRSGEFPGMESPAITRAGSEIAPHDQPSCEQPPNQQPSHELPAPHNQLSYEWPPSHADTQPAHTHSTPGAPPATEPAQESSASGPRGLVDASRGFDGRRDFDADPGGSVFGRGYSMQLASQGSGAPLMDEHSQGSNSPHFAHQVGLFSHAGNAAPTAEPDQNTGVACFGRNGSMLPPSQAGNTVFDPHTEAMLACNSSIGGSPQLSSHAAAPEHLQQQQQRRQQEQQLLSSYGRNGSMLPPSQAGNTSLEADAQAAALVQHSSGLGSSQPPHNAAVPPTLTRTSHDTGAVPTPTQPSQHHGNMHS